MPEVQPLRNNIFHLIAQPSAVKPGATSKHFEIPYTFPPKHFEIPAIYIIFAFKIRILSSIAMERIFKRKKFPSRITSDYLIYTKDLRKDGPILLVPVFMTMFL